MSLFIHVLADIFHIIKIILVCDMFFMFEKRERKHKKTVLTAIAFFTTLISVSIYFLEKEFIETLIYITGTCIMLCWLYREKLLNMIISGIWIVFAMSMIDLISIVLVQVILNLIGFKYNSNFDLTVTIISLSFIFIVGKIYDKKYNEGIKTIGIRNLIIFTLLALADTFVTMIMATIMSDESYGDHKIVISIALILVILGIFLQLAAVILLFMQRNVYKEKKQVTEKYLNEQKNHYEYLEKREKETKKFRHDLRNHMQMLSNLAKNRQYEEFDKYLEKIDIKMESFGNIITVQNGIVDAIVNQYYSKAIQSGIEMEVKGRFPADCAIDAYDLCTIFSNVLSNALEAATKAEEKTISVDCRYTEKNIIIVVKNSFNDVGQFNHGKIRTCKEDIDYHGYGLENIRDSLGKYNGVLDIEIANGEFILTILFNYVEKREYEDCDYR